MRNPEQAPVVPEPSTSEVSSDLEKLEKREVDESNESNESRKVTLDKFKDFVSGRGQELREALREPFKKGKRLEEVIYNDFYSADIDNLKYDEQDPAFPKLKKQYDKATTEIQEEFAKKEKKLWPRIIIKADPYWLKGTTGVSFPTSDRTEIGRFYLNIKAEKMPVFFKNVVKALDKADLHSEIKIPTLATAKFLNRRDKCVFYFYEGEEEKTLDQLEKLYKKNRTWFEKSDLPPFSGRMKDSQGEIMEGIGFAQNPFLADRSFGKVISEILADVYFEAEDKGLSVDDDGFNFNESFERNCRKYFVDPKNPCFNLGEGGKEKFPLARERLKTPSAETPQKPKKKGRPKQ